MRAELRPIDQQRTLALLANWISGEADAVHLILDQANAEEFGINGLVLGLLDYAAKATALVPTPPPDDPDVLLNDPSPDVE